ncbi:MAG: RNA-binding S4 domain-containing protein, partial [Hyphococcus sp.]
SARVSKTSFQLRAGDTLVFSRNDRLHIVEVVSLAERRGPAAEAQTLYNDRSPPRPKASSAPASQAARDKGAGRPTKKDRRALQALKLSSQN